MARFFFSVLILLGFFAVAEAQQNRHPALPATAPATQPLTPEKAIYHDRVELINYLLDNPTDEELRAEAHHFLHTGDYDRATMLYLIALRSKPNDPNIEFDIAQAFAVWRQDKLGMDYFQKAADHGYWGYRVITDDVDFNFIKKNPAFPAALAKIKTSFAIEAPKHPPGSTLKTPAGDPPADGWPVVFFLHGWGSNRHDFDDEAAFVATLGYVGITLDATEVMGPGACTWTHDSVAPTNDQIQAALKALKIKVNPKRIYLQGFSQGAMHAAGLLTDHPDLYAGAICNSPGSYFLLPKKLADPDHTGTIVLSVGDAESPSIGLAVKGLQKLWDDAKRPVHIIHFKGGHQLPPDSESMFRTALEQLSATK